MDIYKEKMVDLHIAYEVVKIADVQINTKLHGCIFVLSFYLFSLPGTPVLLVSLLLI